MRDAPTAGRSRPSRSTKATSATAAAARSGPGSFAWRGRGATTARRWSKRRRSHSTTPRWRSSRRRRLRCRRSRWPQTCRLRPLVLGGCCCSHVGAVEGLAARHGRVAVLWLDAHGDLNTPETSPSGNEWGMPLRMLIDRGTIAAPDVVLWGARNLDPPEEEFIAAAGIGDDPDALLQALGCRLRRARLRRASTPASSPSSCPSPAGRRSARSNGCSRAYGTAASSSAWVSPAWRPIPRTSSKLERLAASLGY